MDLHDYHKILHRRAANLPTVAACWLRLLLLLSCSFLLTAPAAGQNDNARLTAGEITRAAQLAEKLRTRTDNVSQYLWENLSPDTQELLTQENNTDAPAEPLLKALLADLNRIIQGPVWYEESRFAGVTLAPETARLLRSSPTDAQFMRFLNRWLLEDAYPQEIVATKFPVTSKPPVYWPAPPPASAALKPRPAPEGMTPPVAAPPAPLPTPPLPAGLETSPFYQALQRLGVRLPEDCYDEVGQRIVAEYGAVFVAQDVKPPTRCLFADEAATQDFQGQSELSQTVTVRGVRMTLQSQALSLFGAAYNEGLRTGVKLTPRGADAAQRSWGKTVELWHSRVAPALTHWTQRGNVTPAEAARIRALAVREQVAAVLELEAQGLYFSKDLAKSILFSVAAPGSSQHIALLALDITEFESPRARALLAKYGWFQTVRSDLPHFTFLGVSEDQLPALGLRLEIVNGHRFWLPDLRPAAPPQQ